MNEVKEKKDNNVLNYEELFHLLKSESLSDSVEPITIESTRLYIKVKELTEMAVPTQVNQRDRRWNYFYVPLKYHGKNAVIPMSIMEYNSSYYIYFPSTESLRSLRVTEGNSEYSSVYDKVISGAAEFLPNLVDIKSLEDLVPYEFRAGKIRGKYVLGKEWLIKEEEAEMILSEYEEHIKHIDELPMAGASISLNDYLRVVYIAYEAVFEEVKEMTPKEAYEYLADFRHGGMLNIKDPNSAEQFNKWLSNIPAGSHPFEIVAGFGLVGISLVPPMLAEYSSGEKYFVISAGSLVYYKTYLAMLKALMHEKVPVIAPQLEEILEYLTGESYFLVNRYGSEGVSYRDVQPEYFAYIEWDPLEVVKPKAAFSTRE